METGTEEQAPPMPGQGNTDISQGPTSLPLPAPYQPPSNIEQPSQGGAIAPDWWIPHPPQQRPWSALPFAQAAFQSLPPDAANKAITVALRLEGLLGFDADRKAGVPVAEAQAKWASKLYADHPAVAAAMMKQPAKPFSPTETQVGGQSLIQMSPNRFSFKPKALGEGLKPSDVLHATTAELTQLAKAIDQADADRDKPAVRALRQRHSEVLNRLHDMTAGAPAAGKKKRPSKGFVESGHRFKDLSGVPANDPRNWEPVE
jgi:hypothetical protein